MGPIILFVKRRVLYYPYRLIGYLKSVSKTLKAVDKRNNDILSEIRHLRREVERLKGTSSQLSKVLATSKLAEFRARQILRALKHSDNPRMEPLQSSSVMGGQEELLKASSTSEFKAEEVLEATDSAEAIMVQNDLNSIDVTKLVDPSFDDSLTGGKKPAAAAAEEKKLLKSARVNYDLSDFDRCTSICFQLLEINPSASAGIYLLLVNSLMASLRYDEAGEIALKGLQLYTNDIQLLTRRLDALAGCSRHAECVRIIEKMIENGVDTSSRIKRRRASHYNLIESDQESSSYSSLTNVFKEPTTYQMDILEGVRREGFFVGDLDKLVFDDDLIERARRGYSEFESTARVQDLAADIEAARTLSGMRAADGSSAKSKPANVTHLNELGAMSVAHPISQIYLQNSVLQIAAMYYDELPKLRNVNLWLNPALNLDVEERHGSQFWHRDQESDRILKLFIYFGDAGADQGPTEYIRFSHSAATGGSKYSFLHPYPSSSGYPRENLLKERVEKSDFVSLQGREGQFLFLDTNGFHRGGTTISGRRRLSMGTYLRKNSSFLDITSSLKPEASIPLSQLQQHCVV